MHQTIIGQTNPVAIMFFLLFVATTLGITYWAAKRTRTTKDFYAAGRSITGFQNGLALAGDYMSAASFLGIAGLVSTKGYDGLIYSVGWLVGWPIIMFLISEPLRNLGKYTFADVVAYRLQQRPIRPLPLPVQRDPEGGAPAQAGGGDLRCGEQRWRRSRVGAPPA